MRPLKLEFSGIRTYRGKQTIDFTGKSLVAIIGPTGAGKSSILEAIFFALYGNCTWNMKSSKPLVADGGNRTANATLTFKAQGRTWRVTRSVSRGSTPPPVNTLVNLANGDEVSGATSVTDQITALLGLDRHAFLKAIILPQGKFQELLHASKTERSQILRTLLGLDTLFTIREDAKQRAARLSPLLEGLRAQRDQYPNDVEADYAAAAQDLTSATEQLDRLESVHVIMSQATEGSSQRRRYAQECQSAARKLQQHVDSDVIDDYQTLLDIDTRLQRELTEITGQIDAVDHNLQTAEAQLHDADESGTGLQATRSALTDLKLLSHQHAELTSVRNELDQDRLTNETDAAALETLKATVESARADADQATKYADELVSRTRVASERLRSVRNQLTHTRAARITVDNAIGSHADALTAVETAEHAEADAVEALSDSQRQFDQAIEDHEQQRRRTSAAHAAENSSPGDPCPICTRTLPSDFAAPQSADDTKMTKYVAACKRRVIKYQKAAQDTSNSVAAARTTLNHSQSELYLARSTFNNHADILNSTLGPVDLSQDDRQLLKAIDIEAQLAQTGLQKARQAAMDKGSQAATLYAQAGERATELTRQRDKYQQSVANCDKRSQELEGIRAGLPESFTVPRLSDELIAGAIIAAQCRESDLHAIEDKKKEAQARRDSLSDCRDQCKQQHEDEVRSPAKPLYQQVQRIIVALEHASTLVEHLAVPSLQPNNALRSEVAWASYIVHNAAKAAQQCEAAEFEANQAIKVLESKVSAALRSVGMNDPDEFQGPFRKASQAKARTQTTTEHLQKVRPIVADLDRRIGIAHTHVTCLADLATLLSDSKFTGEMVRLRQKALLAMAGTILKSMTHQQFTFTPNFEILDTRTYQARDVKTLSGGETFQASLALALAVVESTKREGGRAEALFLDEGFGTLDSQALDFALEALEQQAQAGRLVTVITHIKKVAENVLDVLIIEKTPTGSTAHWATNKERHQLENDDGFEHLHELAMGNLFLCAASAGQSGAMAASQRPTDATYR